MTRSIPRRFAAIALAIMLVAVAIGGGLGPSPVGSAEAAGPLADCSWYDSTYGGFTAVMLQTISGTGCTIGDDADPGTAAMGDVYASATTLQSTQDTALSMVDNRLTDARGPAYAEAKIAMVEEFKAGANKSVARQAAYDAIEDYYSPIVANLDTLWTQKVLYWNYSWHAEVQSTGSAGAWVGGENLPLDEVGGNHYPNITHRQLTLPNGSTVPTVAIHGNLSGTWYDLHWSNNESLSGDLPTKHPDPSKNQLVYSHTSDYTYLVFLEAPASGSESWDYDRLKDISSTSGVNEPDDTFEYYHAKVYDEIAQLKTNIDPLVNKTYQQYEPSELDTTGLLSPTELASRASTDYNSTGYHSFLAAQLAMMGYSGNIPISHTVESNGSTYNGSLFYTGDNLTEIETGVTYDPANYTGSFVMAYQLENGSEMRDLTEPFTVTEQINTQTGETVANASIEQYAYSTNNASNLADELSQLIEAREDLLGETPSNSSGGGGLFASFGSFLDGIIPSIPSLSNLPGGAILVGVATALLLLTRGG
jgi:hypothetical protein